MTVTWKACDSSSSLTTRYARAHRNSSCEHRRGRVAQEPPPSTIAGSCLPHHGVAGRVVLVSRDAPQEGLFGGVVANGTRGYFGGESPRGTCAWGPRLHCRTTLRSCMFVVPSPHNV